MRMAIIKPLRWRRKRLVALGIPFLLLAIISILRLHQTAPPSESARVAYFIQVSASNLPLLSRLLVALYDPTNYYALHLDLKIPEHVGHAALLEAFRTLSQRWAVDKAANVPNVLVMRSEIVTYRGATMTMNYLTGANRLLAAGDWDYFVNLSGADYPTASQRIIKKLLGSAKGRNFVEWKPRDTWRGFAERRLGEFYIDTGLAKLHQADSLYIDALGNNVSREAGQDRVTNPLVKHLDFTIAKTSGWFIFSRAFCEHLRGDSDARKMMALLSFSDASDEHFFGTVLWNKERWKRSAVPGNLRTIFFVAPNGSLAMGEDGVRSRQHPFWVDEEDEDGFLFWNELMQVPAFFTRKIRDGNAFRDRVDREMLGIGSDVSAYEERLTKRFNELVARDEDGTGEWPEEDLSY